MFWTVLICQQILHHVILKHLFKSAKPSRMRYLQAAGAFVLLVSFAVAFEVKDRPAGLFSILDVPRNAQRHEIKAAYKKQSILYHPDKNPGPEAELRFLKVKEAYDVVLDDSARSAYDRFGMLLADQSQTQAFMNQASTYVNFYIQLYGPALFLTFLSTRGVRRAGAFTWALVPLFALALCDVFARHTATDYDLLVPVLPHVTLHEKLEVLHFSYIFIVGVIAFIVERAYVDRDAALLEQIQDLRAMVDVLLPAEPLADGTDAPKVPPHVRLANLRKQRAQLHAQAQQAATGQQKGTNWMQLIFLAIFLYNLLAPLASSASK